VPYRSTPQSIQDIAAGHVALGWAEAGASIPLIREGKLRALASRPRRGCHCLPDVRRSPRPPPRRASRRCRGICCSRPGGRRRDIVDRLHADMKRVLAEPDLRQKIETIGLSRSTRRRSRICAPIARRAGEVGALVKKLGLEGSQ